MPVADFGAPELGVRRCVPVRPGASYGTPETSALRGRSAFARSWGVPGRGVQPLRAEGTICRRSRRTSSRAPYALGRRGQLGRAGAARRCASSLWRTRSTGCDEFRLDGLRLDAVHAILDDSRRTCWRTSRDRTRGVTDRVRPPCARERRNELRRMEPRATRHRPCSRRNGTTTCTTCCMSRRPARAAVTTGVPARYRLFGRALAEGFAHQGEVLLQRPCARRAERAPDAQAFVTFIQNHDQIGNRAFGERIEALAARTRCARSPYLFAGAATPPCCSWARIGARASPFLFFCDFDGELAQAVRKAGARSSAAFPNSPTPRPRAHSRSAGGVDLPGFQVALGRGQPATARPAIALVPAHPGGAARTDRAAVAVDAARRHIPGHRRRRRVRELAVRGRKIAAAVGEPRPADGGVSLRPES